METEIAAPAEPKFETRGFAPEGEEPAAGEKPLTAAEADAIMGGMPTGEEPIVEDTTAPAAIEPAAAKIKIGSREFANTDEAWAYAQELEQEKIAADAFRHGVETATQASQSNLPPAPPVVEELDPEFYTNPQEYMRKRDEKVIAQAQARIRAEADMTAKNTQTWETFYRDYPDLSSAQVLVQTALSQNFERLKHVQLPIALKEIAEKARAMKKQIIEAELPGRTLPKVAAAASAGRGTGVTPKEPLAQDLTFTDQLKNMRKNRTAKMRR